MKTYGPFFNALVNGHYRPIADEYDIKYSGQGHDYKDLLNVIKKYSNVAITGYSFEHVIISNGNDIKNHIKNDEKFSILVCSSGDRSNINLKRYDYLGKDYIENIMNSFSKKYENKIYSKRMITEEIIEKNEEYVRKIYSDINFKNMMDCMYKRYRSLQQFKGSQEEQEQIQSILSLKERMLQEYSEFKKEINWVFRDLINLEEYFETFYHKIVNEYLFENFGEDYKVYNLYNGTIYDTIKSFCKEDIIYIANASDCNYRLNEIFKPVSKVIYHRVSLEKEKSYHADKRAFNLYGFFRDMGNCNNEYSLLD